MVGPRDKIKRRSAPKAKSGCKTCKIRRIKCDETRPNCANCTSTGRACDGYPPSFQFHAVTIQLVDKSVASIRPNLTPVTRQRESPERYQSSEPGHENFLMAATPLQQPNIFPGTLQERYFFTNFCRYLAPRLGGYFDSDFWNVQLPRIAYSELAVYHAMIAIAAFDQNDMLDPEALHSEQQVPFLLHYNKAIHFVKYQFQKDGNSQHVILLTCLLFICLEFRRGNTDVALNHLQSGLAILHSQKSNHGPSELSDISESLAHAFSHLGIQGSLVGHQPPPGFHHTLNASQLGNIPFSNIGEARNSLMSLFTESLKPIGPEFKFEASFTISVSEQSRRATLVSQLHQWNSQLSLFMTNILGGPTPQDLRMIRLLRIQSLVAIIWNSTTIPPSDGSSIEPSFDAYTNMFNTIISLATFIIDDPAIPTSTSDLTPLSVYSTPSANYSTSALALIPGIATSRLQSTFSIEMGLIFILYFVAIKCRSPILRRRATYFLSRVEPRREGMWDARVLEKTSQYVIETEEMGCVKPITEEVRTWPGVERRLQGVYIFPRCDYAKRVQRVQCLRGSGGREGDEWVVDIGF